MDFGVWFTISLVFILGPFSLENVREDDLNSVQTRCIVKTSGFTRRVCKNR